MISGESLLKVIGIVTYVDDELNLGRIKVNAPGLFTSDNPKDDLPWVYPSSQGHTNQFRSPKVGDSVWVTHPPFNYSEYWYEPFPQLDDTAREIISDYDNAEILMARTTASGNTASVYVTDEAGVNVTGEGSKINLNTEGDITLVSAQKKAVLIEADTVKLGEADGAHQPAVLGDELRTLLTNLANNLNLVATNVQMDMMTSNTISTALTNTATTLNADIQKILSSNVKLN